VPAIEFVGYTREESIERMNRYIKLFSHLDFADDFIFIIESDTRVIGLDGIEQPLVRVRSRFQERNEITREILRDHEDVETLVIDFRPRRQQAPQEN
jgi:hypothetical protein